MTRKRYSPTIQRMYFLVMYNLSDIQKGIQAGHAQQEYCNRYWSHEDFQDWAQNDKTWMVMSGGTSNQSGTNKYNDDFMTGSMEQYHTLFIEKDIKHAAFYEPDLNNATSAIAFLVPDQVFDKEQYPDPDMSAFKKLMKDFNLSPEEYQAELNKKLKEMYNFSDEILFLREFCPKLRFA